MLSNLILGIPTMALCLALQAVLSAVAIGYYSRRQRRVQRITYWHSLNVISMVMTLLVLGNFAQIILWAVLFQLIGEFEALSDAVYHSAVNFATLGYGDIVMSESHRLLGPLESINGVLMIGVSTAMVTAAFQDSMRRMQRSRRSQT